MKTAGITATIFGLLNLLSQLIVPDLVPDAILSTLNSTPNISQFTGYEIALKASLFTYVIGGWVLFIGGIILFAIGQSRE